MRRMMATIAAMAVTAGGASVAMARAKPAPAAAPAAGGEKKVKEKFYNFDDLLIDGEYRKPNALLFTAKDKVQFDRLLKLRKSFIPVILTSDRERALR